MQSTNIASLHWHNHDFKTTSESEPMRYHSEPMPTALTHVMPTANNRHAKTLRFHSEQMQCISVAHGSTNTHHCSPHSAPESTTRYSRDRSAMPECAQAKATSTWTLSCHFFIHLAYTLVWLGFFLTISCMPFTCFNACAPTTRAHRQRTIWSVVCSGGWTGPRHL